MNKDVCHRCYLANIVNNPGIKKGQYWRIEEFDLAWDTETVICPHHIVFPALAKGPGTWTVTKDSAFKLCPRKFEHAIAETVNIDKK